MSFLNFAVVQFQKAEAKNNTKRPFRVAIGFSMMIKLTDEWQLNVIEKLL